MPPDISGPGPASGGGPLPPATPVRPVPATRAIAPAERSGTRPPPPESPLGRSGVSLTDLLLAPDTLAARKTVAPVALELGLETARRQLLQRQPEAALESLDAVWGRATASEEGWYLRSGALTVSGHPVEGERVASDGLDAQPHSLALRLLQSVARAVVGDLAGARAALVPAMEQAPEEPVLLAQQAVVLARQGHRDDADALLQQLAARGPEHPALAWARLAVRTAGADRVRHAARPAMSEGTAWRPPAGAAGATGEAPPAAVEDEMTVSMPADQPQEDGDMVTSAFRRLGAAVVAADDDTLQQSARTLLRGCSAGGALASACTPQEAHAARQVLSALLTVLRHERPTPVPGASPSPLTPLVRQLLPLLRQGPDAAARLTGRSPRVADAERLLRRQGGGVPPVVRAFLAVLLDGAANTAPRAPVDEGRGHEDRPGVHGADRPEILGRLVEDQDAGPLVPVRLGLGLLAETSATRAFERQQELLDVTPPLAAGVIPGDVRGETSGTGWGGARAAQDTAHAAAATSRPVGAALPAIVLVGAALGAAMNGAAGVAALLAGAALWLSLRRPPRRP